MTEAGKRWVESLVQPVMKDWSDAAGFFISAFVAKVEKRASITAIEHTGQPIPDDDDYAHAFKTLTREMIGEAK